MDADDHNYIVNKSFQHRKKQKYRLKNKLDQI